MSSLTTDPNDPRLKVGSPQHEAYLVLSEEERAKGFVRPLRDSYKHVGTRPKYPTRELTPEEHERYNVALGCDYAAYEPYPESERPVTGRYWTARQLRSGCGVITTMAREIAATYARNPKFYGSTYCVGCAVHLPVEEFAWEPDGSVLGS
jgi:hypothetical protein